MQPLVSVIIPVFNTEEYLEKCIDSMVNQSLANIEILVINDCSEGDTESVMDKYINNTKIKYHKLNQNIGLGAVRNIGIKKATGKFIAFCDSDDWVDLFLYESMASALENTKAEIAICGTLKEFPSGEDSVIKSSFEKEIVLDIDTAFKIMTFQYDVGITITPSANNKMIRKSFLDKHKINFAEKVYYEDLYFSFKALLYADKIVGVPQYYHHYLRRDNSIIISISKYHIESFYSVFSQIKSFLVDNDLFEEYKFNYYKFGERFYNLIIRQIFEFSKDEETQKELLEYSVGFVKRLITMEEFIKYTSAEKLRKHLQPFVESTKII
jgi:glycosyltransferase involved in cell wall biosynthesis